MSNSSHGHALPAKIAISIFLAGRYLFASFFWYGVWHKLTKGWLWSDILQSFLTAQLNNSRLLPLQVSFLEQFAIPNAFLIAWIVTIGELLVAIGLTLGITVRLSGFLALFLMLNFTAGGYHNYLTLPLLSMAFLLMILPSGQWLGFDKKLHERYPNVLIFK